MYARLKVHSSKIISPSIVSLQKILVILEPWDVKVLQLVVFYIIIIIIIIIQLLV